MDLLWYRKKWSKRQTNNQTLYEVFAELTDRNALVSILFSSFIGLNTVTFSAY
jgi:hypothetical protein